MPAWSISLLIIHGCSTCRDACQLCKDTSHLPCFCKYILSHFLWMAVCLSHTHAHTCSALYIVGPNLPGSYRLISEALCQSVVWLTTPLANLPNPFLKVFEGFLHYGRVCNRFLESSHFNLPLMVSSHITNDFSCCRETLYEISGTPKDGMYHSILYLLHSI